MQAQILLTLSVGSLKALVDSEWERELVHRGVAAKALGHLWAVKGARDCAMLHEEAPRKPAEVGVAIKAHCHKQVHSAPYGHGGRQLLQPVCPLQEEPRRDAAWGPAEGCVGGHLSTRHGGPDWSDATVCKQAEFASVHAENAHVRRLPRKEGDISGYLLRLLSDQSIVIACDQSACESGYTERITRTDTRAA